MKALEDFQGKLQHISWGSELTVAIPNHNVYLSHILLCRETLFKGKYSSNVIPLLRLPHPLASFSLDITMPTSTNFNYMHKRCTEILGQGIVEKISSRLNSKWFTKNPWEMQHFQTMIDN